MRVMILALALVGQLAVAQDLQDVIYKSDGSILRGTLIEQDFQNGRYKIQLQGGSVFSVTKDDIEKITKEAPLNSAVAGNGININIENNPSITQTPSQSVQQNPVTQAYSYIEPQEIQSRHSLRIGPMSKELTDSDDNGYSFSGYNIAYQYNRTENVAFYAEYNSADLDGEVRDGDIYDISSDFKDNVSFRGTEFSVMLSTNNYQGWQFYAGLGVFQETYQYFASSIDASGVVATLGMGYSWQAMQIQIRASGHASDDYNNEILGGNQDFSSSNAVLQLGFNF